MSSPIPKNRAPFTVSEILEQTGGKVLREGADRAVGVGTDTRQDLSGAVFVALRGETFDGHAFLDVAAARGAALLLVEEGRARAAPAGVTVLEVPDTLVALGELGRLHRQRWGGKAVAIAGSAGKTTTRSVTARLLETLLPGQVHATQGNLNNRIGVPLTLLALEPHHRVAVIEVGTNLPGEVPLLAALVRPDIAVLTLIDLEHTEGLLDLEGVAREEGAIFDSLSPSGTAVGNADDPRVREKLGQHAGRRVGYGEGPQAELVVRSRRLITPTTTELLLETGARSWKFEVPLLGVPGALAVAAATAVCEELAPGQLTNDHFVRALESGAEPGRSFVRLLDAGRVLLDDTYNSNPASARQAIRSGQELARLTGGKLWLVLGEMRELGALSSREHESLGEVAARSGAAGLFAVGQQAEPTARAARAAGLPTWHEADAAAVGPQLWPRLSKRDVVVVKASRGVRAERVVQYLADVDGRSSPGAAST